MLEPKRAVQERVILRRRSHIEPDAPQPVQRLEFRARDMAVIVPQRSALQGRPVDCKRHPKQKCKGCEVADVENGGGLGLGYHLPARNGRNLLCGGGGTAFFGHVAADFNGGCRPVAVILTSGMSVSTLY